MSNKKEPQESSRYAQKEIRKIRTDCQASSTQWYSAAKIGIKMQYIGLKLIVTRPEP